MESFGLKPLKEGVRLPEKAYKNDAGFDVFAPEKITIKAGMWAKIPLGFALMLHPGTVCLMMEKSGLATKHGLFSIAGVIDASYRGECHAVMFNMGPVDLTFKKGDKLAQFLVVPCYTERRYNVLTKFDDYVFENDRGTGGFGSSGDR